MLLELLLHISRAKIKRLDKTSILKDILYEKIFASNIFYNRSGFQLKSMG